MPNLRFISSIVLLFLLSCKKEQSVQPTPAPFEIKGADVSFLPSIRQSGIVLRNAAGVAQDQLQTLQQSGVNTIRLRLWYQPVGSNSSFETVKALAQEARTDGFKILLSVHYADTWADPGQQTKPVVWQSLSLAALNDSVAAYSQRIAQEIAPDYMQIGNEINGGFLWPDGSIANLVNMKSLLRSAISAVRQYAPSTKIVLHYAGTDGASAFFAQLTDLDYDIIGISYYPNWHGKDLVALQQSLQSLAASYHKKIMIAETSYPFTLNWSDQTNNVIGTTDQILSAYTPTPAGQKAFLQKIRSLVKAVPDGIGFCYWGGEWVSYRGSTATDGSAWENQAFWDFDFKALPVLEAYQ